MVRSNKGRLGDVLLRYGVGISSHFYILRRMGLKKFNPRKCDSLPVFERVSGLVEELGLGSSLQGRRVREANKLIRIKCYRAFRFLQGLPAHGQCTQTNAKTSKRRRGSFARSFSVSKTRRYQEKKSASVIREELNATTLSSSDISTVTSKFFSPLTPFGEYFISKWQNDSSIRRRGGK